MTWVGISKIVSTLAPAVRRLPRDADRAVREAAATIVAATYGTDVLLEHPPLVNVGVLATLSRGAPATYLIRPSGSSVIHATDLRSIPAESPPMLLEPGIVEARRPETGERLWGDVASLGWYRIEGAQMYPPSLTDAIMLVGVHYPDGVQVARWIPAWTGEDLEEQLPTMATAGSADALVELARRAAHLQFARDAARYLTIFGLLEQVEDGPLRFEVEKGSRVRQVRTKDLSARGLRQPAQSRPLIDATTPIDPRARVLAEALVHGYLQRFRVGPGRQRVEWRYVKEHAAKRWYAPKINVERDFTHTGLANSALVFRGTK